jgi:hypothetical protein
MHRDAREGVCHLGWKAVRRVALCLLTPALAGLTQLQAKPNLARVSGHYKLDETAGSRSLG